MNQIFRIAIFSTIFLISGYSYAVEFVYQAAEKGSYQYFPSTTFLNTFYPRNCHGDEAGAMQQAMSNSEIAAQTFYDQTLCGATTAVNISPDWFIFNPISILSAMPASCPTQNTNQWIRLVGDLKPFTTQMYTMGTPNGSCDIFNLTDVVYRYRYMLCIAGFSFSSKGVEPNSLCSREVLATTPIPEKQPKEGCCPKEGNPIDPITGMKFEQATDYQGTGPFPLKLERYYSSDPDLNATSNKSSTDGFGRRWRHYYERSVYFSEAVISSTNENIATVYVHRADGQTFFFNGVAGTWTSDADVTETLTELVDGATVRIGWEYRDNNDTVEVYDIEGRLLSITNRQGFSQTLEYDITLANGGDDNADTLDKVTGPFGRTLSFTYDVNGRIATLTDPVGEVYTYAYDANGNLSTITYPDETPLDSNDNPTRVYHYEDVNFIHALTGITNENSNRFATWAYDTQGRAILSEHAGGAETVTLVYNADGTTSATDSLGRNQTYHFETYHGVRKITQIDGGPCVSCGAQHQTTTYDANGFANSRTDFNGNQTTFINDARGLQTSRTEAVGTPEERIITTEWHPTFRLPTKITEPGKITNFTYDAQGRLLERREEIAP